MGIEPTTLICEHEELHAEQGQRPLGPCDIEIVCAQNLEVTKPVTQTQFMVGLKLIPVADPANTLEVFPAIWIPCP